jgi:hypothetical protein
MRKGPGTCQKKGPFAVCCANAAQSRCLNKPGGGVISQTPVHRAAAGAKTRDELELVVIAFTSYTCRTSAHSPPSARPAPAGWGGGEWGEQRAAQNSKQSEGIGQGKGKRGRSWQEAGGGSVSVSVRERECEADVRVCQSGEVGGVRGPPVGLF